MEVTGYARSTHTIINLFDLLGSQGSHILRVTAEHHSNTAPLVHLNMFYCAEPLLAQYTSYLTSLPLPASVTHWVAEKGRFWGLGEPEIKALRRSDEFLDTGGTRIFLLSSSTKHANGS